MQSIRTPHKSLSVQIWIRVDMTESQTAEANHGEVAGIWN